MSDKDPTDPEKKKVGKPKNKPTGDYAVGWCKPPPDGQFKKGESGNPKGRPKGAKSNKTLFKENFETKQSLTLNGKAAKLTAMELSYKQIAQKASAGDIRFIKLALALAAQFSENRTDVSTADLEVDLALLEEFVKKQKPEGWEDSNGT